MKSCDKEELRRALKLYAVTDRAWLNGRTLEEQAEEALRAGVTMLQAREKDLEEGAFMQEALRLRKIAGRFRVPLIVDDNLRVALSSGADGVHVGQSDLPAARARAEIGPEKILGVSAQTVEQAVRAEKDGADYLGVGSVFPTSTKPDADSVPLETLRAICSAVSIPVVAIGGISEQSALRLSGSGIAGISVVSAIFAQKDIPGAVKRLLALAERVTGR